MRGEILSAAAKRNLFFTPEAMELVLSNDSPMDFVNTVFSHLADNVVFVSKEDVMSCIVGDKVIFESPKEIVPRNKVTPDLSIVKSTDVTGESTCEGKINDFAQYFRSRYTTLRRIIERRSDFGRAIDIAKAREYDREVKIVGMVYEKATTKNGHTMLTLEDESGTVKVLVSKDSELASETFVNDEVIGVIGKPNRTKEMIVPDKIFRPDIPLTHKWIPSDTPSKVAVLSDVHVGSNTFLEKDWKRMIEWLKSNAYNEEINYLLLPGDVVDGVGVFPGQDKELRISDIDCQYATLAEYLKDIPDHIKTVIQPGNHDAARLAEPQPALNSRFTKGFDSNILMTGNPVYVEIEGKSFLSYHGKSMDDWISSVRGLSYDNPIAVMKEMCVRRHLAPAYGQRNSLAPEKKDYLSMEIVPDVFVSGHVHSSGSAIYNGVRMINASTWQSQTEYQKQHNFNPDPGIMPIVSLCDGRVEMRNFHR